MQNLARFMAIFGGLILTILIVLVCLSVFGRTMNGVLHGAGSVIAPGLSTWLLDLGVGPINGDFELVVAGIAFAIFAFLPICHLSGGHATVDIFTSRLPVRLNRFLRMVTEVVFAAVLVLIAVRLYAGTLSKLNYGETTFLLQFPIWWAYAASLFGSIIAAVVSVYIALMCIFEAFTGREFLPTPEDAFH
jgi:TRAP-type C4-dicarboxylate transport system permease small subunit